MIRKLLILLTFMSVLKFYTGFALDSEDSENFKNSENLKFLSIPQRKTATHQQDYDMYVFSIQWGATLCHTNTEHCNLRLRSIPKNIFTLHGLWPNYSDGKKMDKCNPGSEIKIEKGASQIFEEMETFWISFSRDDSSFWSHEYNTHGYCYTQKYNIEDPLHYFRYALGIYKEYDFGKLFLRAFGNLSGSHSFEYDDLYHHINRETGDLKYELVCRYYEHKQYLQEVRFFFDLNMKAMDIGRNGDCNPKKPIFVDFQ